MGISGGVEKKLDNLTFDFSLVIYFLSNTLKYTYDSNNLFDVTKQGYSSHSPMSGSYIALKINGSDVVQICSSWFSVDGAFIQLGIFASSGIDSIDVNNRHLFIQNFGSRFHQFSCLSVQTGSFQKQT